MTRQRKVARVLACSAIGLGVLESLHRRFRNWGATPEEIAAVLPGDELVPRPSTSTTRAVTVGAPAEEVWPWLVQMGQGRAGMYSYDLVENLLGLDIHSSWGIDERLQQLEVGDRIRLVPKGWAGMKEGFALPVARIDPGRALVLREDPTEGPWNAVWSFHVVPTGPASCRLISRGTAVDQGFAGRLADALMDPVTLVMTRKMLLGITARAEARVAQTKKAEERGRT
jgi:hypothetical protein